MSQRLVVIAGPGGAGKTRLARRLMGEDAALVLVARDTLRAILVAPVDEWHITQVMGDLATRLLSQGYSVVVDAWNLEKEDRAMWMNVAFGANVTMEWLDVREPKVAALIPWEEAA